MGNRFPDQQLAGVRLGHQRKLLPGVRVQVDGRLLGEVIAVTLAPLPVSLHKGVLTDPGDTVHMPEGVHIVHPFLAAVRPHRAVKVLVGAGVALLQKRDQIVAQCGLGLARQLELAVHGFQVVTNRIHRSILRQNLPFVKCKARDLHRVRLIRLHLADVDPVLVILDGKRIDGRYEEARAVHGSRERFIVPSRMFHDNPNLAV